MAAAPICDTPICAIYRYRYAIVNTSGRRARNERAFDCDCDDACVCVRIVFTCTRHIKEHGVCNGLTMVVSTDAAMRKDHRTQIRTNLFPPWTRSRTPDALFSVYRPLYVICARRLWHVSSRAFQIRLKIDRQRVCVRTNMIPTRDGIRIICFFFPEIIPNNRSFNLSACDARNKASGLRTRERTMFTNTTPVSSRCVGIHRG